MKTECWNSCAFYLRRAIVPILGRCLTRRQMWLNSISPSSGMLMKSFAIRPDIAELPKGAFSVQLGVSNL
jgi:hypothetical protein